MIRRVGWLRRGAPRAECRACAGRRPGRRRGRATASPSRPARRPTRSSRPARRPGRRRRHGPQQQAERRLGRRSITRYFYDGRPARRSSPRPRTIRATAGGARLTSTTTPADGYQILEVRVPERRSSTTRSTRSGSRSTCRAARRARRATSGSGRRSRRSSRGPSATRGSRPDRRPGRVRGRDDRLRPWRQPTSGGATIFWRERDHRRRRLVCRRQRRPHGPRSPTTGSTSPAASTSIVRAWPEDAEWRNAGRRAADDGPAGARRARRVSTGRSPATCRRLRGPHAAPRGLRRDLLRGREQDRDQRGPRRPDDPPRGVARLVQQRPVRRPLDQRGLRRHATRRGSLDELGAAATRPDR